jgi:hypothetical protein
MRISIFTEVVRHIRISMFLAHRWPHYHLKIRSLICIEPAEHN